MQSQGEHGNTTQEGQNPPHKIRAFFDRKKSGQSDLMHMAYLFLFSPCWCAREEPMGLKSKRQKRNGRRNGGKGGGEEREHFCCQQKHCFMDDVFKVLLLLFVYAFCTLVLLFYLFWPYPSQRIN